jgi:hypothetical protein
LVFIDETWIKTNMAPLRGWGLRGQRLDARVPHGHWKTPNFIAALRHDRLDAPWVIDGPVNAELFANYVEQVLAPMLLKHLMRAAEQRTVETTWRKAGALLDIASPAECANYLVNSAYASV